MKCEIMVVNRGRTRHFKNCEMSDATIEIKKALFKKAEVYHIPDKSKYLELEKRMGTKPLWIVDELTHTALSWNYAEFEQVTEEVLAGNEKVKTKRLNPKQIKFDKEGKIKPSIFISQNSDPLTGFKLTTLTKVSFWEALAKRLKMGLLLTLIYLSAGGGITLVLLELISVIFLKKHLFG